MAIGIKREENFPLLDFDFLAPDTVGEMIEGLTFLEQCAEYSYKKVSSNYVTGEELLTNYNDYGNFTIYSATIENKNDEVLIHKPDKAYSEYKKMINYYGVSIILAFINSGGSKGQLKNGSLLTPLEWVNCGGQFIPNERVEFILSQIESGGILDWDDLHENYKVCSILYQEDRVEHALNSLYKLYGVTEISHDLWLTAIKEALKTRIEIKDRVYKSREKDYLCSFRSITFDNKAEKDAVIGKLSENSFFEIEEEECKNI